MTEHDAADDRLRAAFRSLGETAHEQLSASDLERVWQAVTGELPVSERHELVERMASDPALAEAWRAAVELRRELPEAAGRGRADLASSWGRSWMAAAAALLLVVGAGVVLQLSRRPAGDTFRESRDYLIESLLPSDAVLPRNEFRLRWTRGPEGSRYQVRVTTEDLRVLTTETDLVAPELQVDEQMLASVPRGARVLWQVDARLPGGDVVTSQTFVVRVAD